MTQSMSALPLKRTFYGFRHFLTLLFYGEARYCGVLTRAGKQSPALKLLLTAAIGATVGVFADYAISAVGASMNFVVWLSHVRLDPGDVFLFAIIGALVAVEMRDVQSV